MNTSSQSSSRLDSILKDSKYRLSLFRAEEIKALENRIEEINSNFHAECLVRKKLVQLKPEEVVRQLLLNRLNKDYGYEFNQMKLEHPIHFGRDSSKRADIVIFSKEDPNNEYVIIEVKKPKARDGKEQLRSYCHATGVPIAVWSNGSEIVFNSI